MEKLSKDEFTTMLSLIKRYTETEMDQWQAWKLDTECGNIFIEVSRETRTSKETFIDVSNFLEGYKTDKGQQ